jgi:hypothetical protein
MNTRVFADVVEARGTQARQQKNARQKNNVF